MSVGSSWRSPAIADQYRHHDYADFAQEFLNRNSDYRQDYADTLARSAQSPETAELEHTALAHRWGLRFPTNPQANPREQPALWSPDIAPDVVILEASEPALALPLPPSSEALVEVSLDKERHSVVACGTTRLRLCVRQGAARSVAAFSIHCDGICGLRLAAAARLERAVRGGRVSMDRSALPTAYQRLRYTTLLKILDALKAGASSRDLAYDFIFRAHRPLSGAMWKGSSERRHVLRQITDARRIVAVGYRRLLIHR